MTRVSDQQACDVNFMHARCMLPQQEVVPRPLLSMTFIGSIQTLCNTRGDCLFDSIQANSSNIT